MREARKFRFVRQRGFYARTLRQGIVSARVWYNSRAHQQFQGIMTKSHGQPKSRGYLGATALKRAGPPPFAGRQLRPGLALAAGLAAALAP